MIDALPTSIFDFSEPNNQTNTIGIEQVSIAGK